MKTLTTQDRDAIARDMRGVCEAVGSNADGTEFTEICEWFSFARKSVEVSKEMPVIGETHGLQAFSFQVDGNSTPIHFERRCNPNQVLNIVVLNRFCLATV